MRGPNQDSRVVVALTVVKAAVLGALLTLTLTTGLSATGSAPGHDTVTAPTTGRTSMTLDSPAPAVRRAMARHRCSSGGFEPGTQPASALVRTPRGRLDVVSFDRGWAVFTGERPGVLVALCRGVGRS